MEKSLFEVENMIKVDGNLIMILDSDERATAITSRTFI
jgi:hypothetical protein